MKTSSAFDLSRGFYTDGPLNYIQMTRPAAGRPCTLRILIPDAKARKGQTDEALVEECIQYLDRFVKGAAKPSNSSVRRWKNGLPCGGSSFKIPCRASGRIVLAGDRFGRWPSMDAALASGRMAAKACGGDD